MDGSALRIGSRHRLIVVAQRFLSLLPRITSFGQQVIVQPTTFLKLLLKEALLLLGRVQTILERSKHVQTLA